MLYICDTVRKGKTRVAKYRTLRWKDQWNLGEPVVWLDVAKADQAWERDKGFYIPSGASDDRHRYEKFGRWLLQANRVVWMPTAILYRGRLDFVDGRHRFAWLRDHGAEAIPITTEPSGAKRLSERLGTTARITRVVRSL